MKKGAQHKQLLVSVLGLSINRQTTDYCGVVIVLILHVCEMLELFFLLISFDYRAVCLNCY